MLNSNFFVGCVPFFSTKFASQSPFGPFFVGVRGILLPESGNPVTWPGLSSFWWSLWVPQILRICAGLKYLTIFALWNIFQHWNLELHWTNKCCCFLTKLPLPGKRNDSMVFSGDIWRQSPNSPSFTQGHEILDFLQYINGMGQN